MTVSQHFSGVLTKMLMPDPRDRYSTIEALQRDLALEPHLETLSQCLSSHPSPFTASVQPAPSPLANQYLSPMQREAQAIRTWRERRLKGGSQTAS